MPTFCTLCVDKVNSLRLLCVYKLTNGGKYDGSFRYSNNGDYGHSHRFHHRRDHGSMSGEYYEEINGSRNAGNISERAGG